MTIAAEPPRGGTYEEIAGERRLLMLRMGELERWEDKHEGVFTTWQRMLTEGLSVAETRDLIVLGLIGGGMTDADAEKLMTEQTPDTLWRMREVAGATMAAALLPDEDFWGEDEEDAEPEEQPADEVKKKKRAPSMYAKLSGLLRRRDGDRAR